MNFHSHTPSPDTVISVSPVDFIPEEGKIYSVGFHPWDTDKPITPETWQQLETAVANPQVVAVGECGIDLLKGAPLFRQLQVFKKHVELSEKYKKPLIIHDVRAHDIILGLKRDLEPTQKWAIHGFRYKPSIAKMLTDAGIWLSFGINFNVDSLRQTPESMILAETDDAPDSIEEVVAKLSEAAGRDLFPLLEENTKRFLYG